MYKSGQRTSLIDNLSNHRILITGAAGFLGKQLAAALIQEGADVLGIDRQPLPSRLNVGEGVAGTYLFIQEELRKVLTDAESFLQAVSESRRGVFHMAGLADAPQCFQHPDMAFDSHVRSTFDVLEMCRRIGGATFVYPSTGLVYGQYLKRPAKEEDPVVDGSVYVSMKLSGESMVQLYAKNYSIDTIIARLANTYGPGMGENTVIGRILSHARKKMPIRVREMSSVRDFIFSGDAVEALLRLFARAGEGDEFLMNISTGVGYSVETVVSEAAKLFNVAYEVPEKSLAHDGGSHLVLSNEKIRRLTGWVPKTSLVDGLQKSWVGA